MVSLRPWLANELWFASCRPGWQRFRQSLTCLEVTQTQRLKGYLQVNQGTDFGRRFGFAKLASATDYQRAVPLTNYDDYGEAIDQIGRGAAKVLTTEPVRLFELSSGSTSASKLIPYTATLQAEFQRAIAPWIFDLYARNAALRGGPSYWSITPVTEGRRTTSGGLPIGFDEDSAYLGAWGQWLVEAALAVPNAVKHLRDLSAFRYVTLLFLLRQPQLRLISVWHPTFLSLLLEALPGGWESLIRDIAQGTLSPPGALEAGIAQRLRRRLTPDRQRARQLERLSPGQYSAVWPELALISCWDEGAAAPYARKLASDFPGVRLQGKGLLATEAFVSFPWGEAEGHVLATLSHFFEFLPVDSDGAVKPEQPRLAHELDKGQTYAMVVTTGGGFYRYQLHDLVKIVGHIAQAPCLQFLGKLDQVSDWFGEKLNERFVAEVLERLFGQRHMAPAFAMLAPDPEPARFRYTLYVELPPGQRTRLDGLAEALDQELSQNFHYAYCRRLGQLAPPEVMGLAGPAAEVYLRACQSRGQRLGNIKPVTLHKAADWRQWLEPLRQSEPI
jgi:hypothetical protein